MGFYADGVFPPIMNRVMNTKQKRLIRSRVCATPCGEVIEIGFGTGLNLPHLPPGVEVLRAVEPLERGTVLASERIATSAVPVEFRRTGRAVAATRRRFRRCGAFHVDTVQHP